MSQDNDLTEDELVIRVLLRLPPDMEGQEPRIHQDEDDFLRRVKHPANGLPENGISVFRKFKFASTQEIYDRIGSKKKLMGLSECKLGALKTKKLKFKVSGARGEHVSLRCIDCDMAETEEGICKPKTGATFEACPFFGPDPYDLKSTFNEIEAPAIRKINRKP